MRSLGSHTGFLSIDHRESPGLTADEARQVPGALAVPAGQQLERDTKQCSHCQRTVVLEPQRVRARAWCPKCDHYLCDGCEAIRVKTGDCVPFLQRLDRAATIAERFSHEPDHPQARPDIVLTDVS